MTSFNVGGPVLRASCLVLAAVTMSCSKSAVPAAAAIESAAVTLSASDVTEARMASLTDAVSISGPLEPAQTVMVKSQINGIVRALHADRGTRVRRGETLVELDAVALRGQSAGAKAAIAAADANAALAAQKYESAKQLEAAGAISPIAVKTAEAARQLADAQAAAARAQYATSNENESRATIVSPIDGVVSDRSVEVGEAVKDAGVLFTVVDTRTLELRAQVGVDDAMRVHPGAPVIFTLDAAPTETFRGTVARVDPRADPATRQVGVASRLDNSGGRIIAGQFARGRVLTGVPTPQVVVPISAVSDSSGHASVFVIKAGHLAHRNVVLGVRDEAQGLVAVLSGLTIGEKVLAVPVLGAAEGLAVTFATDTAAARAPAPGKPK